MRNLERIVGAALIALNASGCTPEKGAKKDTTAEKPDCEYFVIQPNSPAAEIYPSLIGHRLSACRNDSDEEVR